MAHNFDVGTRAWQPDPQEGWIASEVEEKKIQGEKVILVFRLENGEVGEDVCSSYATLHITDRSP